MPAISHQPVLQMHSPLRQARRATRRWVHPGAGLALALAAATAASAHPSGLQAWLTCQRDIHAVCPGAGLFHLGALKACMRENFSQLGERCQSVVRDYQAGRQATQPTAERAAPATD